MSVLETKTRQTMRNIPIVTKNLLVINVIVFLASLVITDRTGISALWGGADLTDLFGLHFFLAQNFHVFQLFTYMFMHASFSHIFFNMFALWMFGCVLERVWGARKFLFYYISCGIGAGLMQELAQLVQFYMIASEQIPGFTASEMMIVANNSAAVLNMWTTVGASGAIYAILLAFGMTFPNERIFIFPFPIPIKAKWFVMIYVVVEFFSAFGSSTDGVAHIAHLGGMIFGFFMIRYWNRHPGSNYNRNGGKHFFDSFKRAFNGMGNRDSRGGRDTWENDNATRSGERESDWEYNARKKADQDEIDRILDKIRKSGYDSLTKEEKKKLFDSSKE